MTKQAKTKTAPSGVPMEILKTYEEEPGKKATAAAATDPLEALKAQIAQLQGQLAAQQEAPVKTADPEAPPLLKLTPDYSKLPDMEMDPKGYAVGLQKEIAEVEANKDTLKNWQAKQQEKQAKKAAALLEDFKAEYPDYAEVKPKLLEYFALEAAQAAADRDLDVNHYMFGTKKKFFKDVVKLIDDNGMKPAKEEGEDEDEEEEPENRAFGIPGGGSPAPAAKAGKQAEPTGPQSMFTKLNDWRIKTGFHP